MLVTGKFTIDALSGPVGIYKATETVAQFGVYSLMNWAAILSINLGIMNLLPLPALDGGRLLFFLFEAVRGKPIDKTKRRNGPFCWDCPFDGINVSCYME